MNEEIGGTRVGLFSLTIRNSPLAIFLPKKQEVHCSGTKYHRYGLLEADELRMYAQVNEAVSI